jgi:hypothetical protein
LICDSFCLTVSFDVLNYVAALMMFDVALETTAVYLMDVVAASSFALHRSCGSDYPFAPHRRRRGHATNCHRWLQGWPQLPVECFVVLLPRGHCIGWVVFATTTRLVPPAVVVML